MDLAFYPVMHGLHDCARRPARLRIWPFACIDCNNGRGFHAHSNAPRSAPRLGPGSLEDRGNYRIHGNFRNSDRLFGRRCFERGGAARKFQCSGEADSGLVQASRSVAPALLDHAGACTVSPMNSGGLKPLLAYTDEAFPQARASLIVESPRGVRSLLPGPNPTLVKLPDWLPGNDFAGLVVDRGQLEIRNVVMRQKDACKLTATFSLPLGSELAKRLSLAASVAVTPISPRLFRVHPNQRVLRTIEDNFMPGLSRPAAVVLTARNWETGALEDWAA